MRAVVNVTYGDVTHSGASVEIAYGAMADRLTAAVIAQGENIIAWRNSFPPGSPSQDETPFGFKAFALAATAQTCETLLWCDASIVPLRPLAPLWDLIETQGYWLSANLPHGETARAWTCGEWTADSALEPLGITREEAFQIPHIIGTAFGLDLRHEIARAFLAEYLRLAQDGTAFRGPWNNVGLRASQDPRVLGHRHDQTAASVIAWRLGMRLTTPPAWIVDGIPPTEETVLEIRRRP